MPMFFFNVVAVTGTLEDEEGTELPDLDAARREAIKDARALMSTAIMRGDDISSRRIEICDRDGGVLLSVAFADAITHRK
jgi:hypothetical protein